MSTLALLTAISLALAPDDFDAERAAAIEREQAKETAAVGARYGNKKSTELSREERAQMIRDQQTAEKQVLEKYGMTAKEWARAQMNRTRDQASQVKEANKALETKEKAAAEKASAEKAGGPKEIVIQRGISEENPVVLEETEGATPVVEKGLPAEYDKDQNAATESDSVEKAAEAPAPKAGARGAKK